ncbi:4,5-DOPA dioxygenase extradiol [Breoghania corrubedonensis]|uniref:4,5-DOPA dioxygenase extradiol n=1 Tax=Breoghania corrubedonensis TaxID=665038 RepID=A0A2T5VAZ8_9HYPH|nr:class III extradiol ring-cleavage dioxygenase [Breoghania corrubedonensis]PTW60922.1 4,5-DOPA dioxygenase extradiol [Breoghania corrubedonensis]
MPFIHPLFVSHGSPMLVLQNTAARNFLAGYAASQPRPDAIVSVSAHFEADAPTIVSDPAPDMIYDMYGFPRELYEIVYPAKGDPALAERVAGLVEKAGLAPRLAPRRGFDHGTWVPLKLLYPQADIPVVQVSVQPDKGAAHHLALGRALEPLTRENVLVIGSGSLTHNLHELRAPGGGMRAIDETEPQWVKEFADWVGTRIEEGAVEDLVDYRRRAPFGAENHPSEEHYLPLLVAMGAAIGATGEDPQGRLVHTSAEYGILRMDAFQFAGAASAMAA